jgi:hypothetical protein
MSRNRRDAALECIVYVLLTKTKQLRQFANTHGIGIYALAQVAEPLVPGGLVSGLELLTGFVSLRNMPDVKRTQSRIHTPRDANARKAC